MRRAVFIAGRVGVYFRGDVVCPVQCRDRPRFRWRRPPATAADAEPGSPRSLVGSTSKFGPGGSALKATTAMLRDLRDQVRQVISHRGISGNSYHQHIDRWFSGLNSFISSGPPASRV